MKIYTSYFANLKNLPKNILPISICGSAPQWYDGLQFKRLAPKYWFFKQWKENKDNNYYISCFNKHVLSQITPQEAYQRFVDVINAGIIRENKEYDAVALICYEKPGEFCHRHLVADWLKDAGYEVCGEYLTI